MRYYRQKSIREWLTPDSSRCTSPEQQDMDYLNAPGINDVHELLLNTPRGKGILKAYAENGKLKKNERSLLTRIVHKKEEVKAFKKVSITKDPEKLEDFKISDFRCREIVRDIVELFPTENKNVYYDPHYYKKLTGSGRPGKLITHNSYEKGVMRKMGLLREPRKCKFFKSRSQDMNNNNNYNNDDVIIID